MKAIGASFLFLLTVILIGCTSPSQTSTDSRQSVRRKPLPNLDRTHDWGSVPPPGPMATHSQD